MFSFVVPPFATALFVELYGAGGGGCVATFGGGGGGYVDTLLTVSSQETVNITVGAGGQGGNTPNNGSSTFASLNTRLLIANGGTSSCLVNPIGGIGMGGDVNLMGGWGAYYTTGGVGGSCPGRYGGAGGPGINDGNKFGGGGGTGTNFGGNGADGGVIITW